MSLTTTYTDPAYDSYVTLDEVDVAVKALAGAFPVAKWQGLSTDEKEGLIKRSTSDLNSFQYLGELNSSIQTDMQWPREGTYYLNDKPISYSAVPSFIRMYIVNRCLEYTNTTFEFTDRTAPKVPTSQRVGPLAKDTAATTARFREVADYPSYQLIKPWILGGAVNQVIRA